MRPVHKEVLLFCPDAQTGGPEALHQLGYVINKLGGNAKMAYYGPISRLEMTDGKIRNYTENSPMPQVYAQYQPCVLRETNLGPDTFVVYPEAVVVGYGYSAAMWWLSRDHAIQADPRLNDENFRKQFFANPNVQHLYQSEYAGNYLRTVGARNPLPITDYTDPNFIAYSKSVPMVPSTERANKICFFPRKGAELARDFLTHGSLKHQIDMVPIQNMSKTEVRDTLFSAKIYIDFGNHPGKDRVPREAAVAGALLLLHKAGAANFEGDHPLLPQYKFTRDDVVSGRLHQLIDDILDNPQKHFEAQKPYRDQVLGEQAKFENEVKNFFFS